VNWWKKHKHTNKLSEGPTKERIIAEGRCIGDAHVLTGKKWKRITVVALEDSTVVSINLAIIDKKLKVCKLIRIFQRAFNPKTLPSLLTNTFPYLAN
jgi:hypothetical protein